MLVSAIHQHESPIGIHMSLSSSTSLPPPTLFHPSRLLQSPGLCSLSHTENSHWPSILYMKVKVLVIQSCLTLWPPWTLARQAPLSEGFSKWEYLGGLLFPSAGDLPHPGIKPRSPVLQADSFSSEPPGKPILPIVVHMLPCHSLHSSQLHLPQPRVHKFVPNVCFFTAALQIGS